MTQEQLAESVKIEVRHLRFIEHGQSGPSFAVLVTLADALEVSVGELFEETEIEKPKRGRPKKL